MRHSLIVLFLFTSICYSNAGVFGAGLMLGANTAMSNFSISEPLKTSDAKLGYNFNGFLRVKILSFLIQPELGYTMNRSGFTITEKIKSIETTLNQGEIYSSVLFGYKLGNLRFMGGPVSYSSASESINSNPASELKLTTNSNSESLKFGGQIGIGLDVSKHFTIDARFQKIITKSNLISTVDNVVNNFDGNLGSLSLSIGYSFIKM